MTVTLPKALEADVRGRMDALGLTSPEAVIALAFQRWAHDETAGDLDPDELERELLAGLDSPRRPWTAADLEAIRQRIRDKYGSE